MQARSTGNSPSCLSGCSLFTFFFPFSVRYWGTSNCVTDNKLMNMKLERIESYFLLLMRNFLFMTFSTSVSLLIYSFETHWRIEVVEGVSSILNTALSRRMHNIPSSLMDIHSLAQKMCWCFQNRKSRTPTYNYSYSASNWKVDFSVFEFSMGNHSVNPGSNVRECPSTKMAAFSFLRFLEMNVGDPNSI